MVDYSRNCPIQSNDFSLSIPQLNHVLKLLVNCGFYYGCAPFGIGGICFWQEALCEYDVSLFTPYFKYCEIGYFGNKVVSRKMLRVPSARDSLTMIV